MPLECVSCCSESYAEGQGMQGGKRSEFWGQLGPQFLREWCIYLRIGQMDKPQLNPLYAGFILRFCEDTRSGLSGFESLIAHHLTS